MEIGRSWRKSTLLPEPSRVSARIPSRKEVWRLGEISRETDITIGLACQFRVWHPDSDGEICFRRVFEPFLRIFPVISRGSEF